MRTEIEIRTKLQAGLAAAAHALEHPGARTDGAPNTDLPSPTDERRRRTDERRRRPVRGSEDPES